MSTRGMRSKSIRLSQPCTNMIAKSKNEQICNNYMAGSSRFYYGGGACYNGYAIKCEQESLTPDSLGEWDMGVSNIDMGACLEFCHTKVGAAMSMVQLSHLDGTCSFLDTDSGCPQTSAIAAVLRVCISASPDPKTCCEPYTGADADICVADGGLRGNGQCINGNLIDCTGEWIENTLHVSVAGNLEECFTSCYNAYPGQIEAVNFGLQGGGNQGISQCLSTAFQFGTTPGWAS
jgi:hypothetical protein